VSEESRESVSSLNPPHGLGLVVLFSGQLSVGGAASASLRNL